MKSPSPAASVRKKMWVFRRTPLLLALGLFSSGSYSAAEVGTKLPDASKPRFEGRFVLLTAVSPSAPGRLDALGRELDAAVAEMAPRIPLVVDRPIRIVLEADYLAQIRATDGVGEAVASEKAGAELHLVAHPRDTFAHRFGLAQVLIRRAGATSWPPWLERGAALWLSRQWYGKSYSDWLPVLTAARALPSAAELLATEAQRDGSSLLWTPLAAAVIEGLSGTTLAAKRATPLTPEGVASRLASLSRLPAPALEPRRDGPRRFQRGVSFAMLNSIEHGYHAPSVDTVLGRLGQLGADSVAIMPFAGQREPNQPGLGFFNRSPRGETEIGCLHAARRAQAAGMSVLWKPHLWVGHNSWPGEVAMTSEADWQAWWAAYRRFILHHAFLARWAEADLFAVGVELDKTAHRKEWVELIADVRRLFPGPLTYASNWYGGLEKIPFWADLDYVGVDAYFPLSSSPTASDQELASGAREVVARLAGLAKATGKPLLLTEVGFAAHSAAWVAPHAEGGPFSAEDQARAYRALLRALEGERWLAGLWLWKVFSGGEEAMGSGADFRFLGRAAEAEVARFFKAVGPRLVR